MNPQDKIERLRLALVALKEAADSLIKRSATAAHAEDLWAQCDALEARADDAQSALEDCGYG